jgi:hypothetical protein
MMNLIIKAPSKLAHQAYTGASTCNSVSPTSSAYQANAEDDFLEDLDDKDESIAFTMKGMSLSDADSSSAAAHDVFIQFSTYTNKVYIYI